MELGDCGLFQVIMVLFVHGAVLPAEWTLSFMSYGNYNPGWICKKHLSPHFRLLNDLVIDVNNSNITGKINYINGSENIAGEHISSDTSCEVYSHCGGDVIYSNKSSTIATEWNLTCNKSWITSMMLSVQIIGFIIGAFGAGFLSNILGRKPIHFWVLAIHAGLNVMAMFSANWPIFTILRFFLGITSGSIGVSNFVYPMEFVSDKWRAIVSALPFSNVGGLLFAVAAWLLKDWRYLHLATAILTAAFFFSVLWIPESLRWLTMKGKTEQAIHVIAKISKMNRKTTENFHVIYTIAEEERAKGKSAETYSALDLYRHGFMKRTLIMTYIWTSTVLCYTIVKFGISSLSGNFYLNLILFNLSSICLPVLPLLTNTIGRKWSNILLLALANVCSIGLVILHFRQYNSNNGLLTMLLSLAFNMLITCEWSIIMLFAVEMYPTPLRTLGYSHGSCVARLGGVIAPFLIPHDETTALISYIVMVVLTMSSLAFAFLMPETKGQNLYEHVP